MSDTPTPPSLHPEPFRQILERVALPLLLFTAVLLVLLFLSWFAILPRFTQFAVGNVELSPTEMAAYVSQQESSLSQVEAKRDDLVLPATDPAYSALKTEKRASIDAFDVRTRLLAAALSLPEGAAVVRIDHVSVDGSGAVAVMGSVHDVGLRSMTVLASYIEDVEALPFVDHLVRPAFTRTEAADGTFSSPFTFTFTLRPFSE